MDRIRVLIVDDHSVVRRGLRSFIQFLPDMELVGEACNGREALDLATILRPDVILMDLSMPEMNGIAATVAIKQVMPQVAIIVLTTFCASHTVAEALRAGASGFLVKDVGIDDLAAAIHAVHRGRPYLHAEAVHSLIAAKQSPDTGDQIARLTWRERQVYTMVARGCSNKQIAGELRISAKTASVHVSNVMSKLGLNSRTQVALYALSAGG
jgi:DNA-binding NarL/FixJ family response regulator